MSLDCPKCKKSFSSLYLRESFTCKHCSSKLTGKFNGAFGIAFVLSTIADFIIYPIVYSNFGTNWWPGVLIRIAASTSVFFGLLAVFSNSMATVEIQDE